MAKKYNFSSYYGEKLLQHKDHEVKINTYENHDGEIENVALECMDCGVVIVDSEVLELLEGDVN